MIAAIHQSQYLPWPPYFKKLARADVFILLDGVQFQKNGVQNRNRIRNAAGAFWLTIPVTGSLEDSILEKRLADGRWCERHAKSLRSSYQRSPFWKDHGEDLLRHFGRTYATLGEANEAFFRFLVQRLDIRTPVLRHSELGATGRKSDLVLGLCKEVGADSYLSGVGGKAYLEEAEFERAGVRVVYASFPQPRYEQFHGDFISELSIVDMLFNVPLSEIQGWLREPYEAETRVGTTPGGKGGNR